jgi:hypothetical protein
MKSQETTTLFNMTPSKQTSITNGEYQELLHRIAKQNELIVSIKAQVSICRENVPTNTLKKLLREY